MRSHTLALAGQPNTGKSTIFNALTGSRQHVGNWPGKTVEKKEGAFQYKGKEIQVVDLPGTYTLSSNSPEERIARDYILKGRPELLVVVVDASQLERSCYMLAEVMGMGVPIVVALNMMDVCESRNTAIDTRGVSESLGVPVISMSAASGHGISELQQVISNVLSEKHERVTKPPALSKEMAELVSNIGNTISGHTPDRWPSAWVAEKLVEKDAEVTAIMKEKWPEGDWTCDKTPMDVASSRFEWIKSHLDGHVTKESKTPLERSRWDRIATHPLWGALLCIMVIFAGFALSAAAAFAMMGTILPGITLATGVVSAKLSPTMPLVSDLITQGFLPAAYMLVAMAGFVFAMLLLIGFLEDIGYLPRMAFVTDLLMNRIGLHGKSFMPMFMGLGCNIAAVMGCRVIDNARQRYLTILLSGLVPCPGALITIAFVAALFFGPFMPLFILALLGAFIIQMVLSSLLLRQFVIPGPSTGMVMELPPYHKPNLKTIWGYTWLHFKGFLKKGGTLIAAIVLMVWALSYFPNGNMTESYLASFGRFLEPMGRLMGMDWRLITCLMVSFFSKEAALAAMGVIYGLDISHGGLTAIVMDNISQGAASHGHIAEMLTHTISPASALAFVFALLFSVPCYATIAVIYNETRSLKWTLGSALFYTASSVLWAIAAYQVGLIIF